MPTVRELRDLVCPNCGHLIESVKVIVPDPPRPKPGRGTRPSKPQVEVTCPKGCGTFKVTLRGK